MQGLLRRRSGLPRPRLTLQSTRSSWPPDWRSKENVVVRVWPRKDPDSLLLLSLLLQLSEQTEEILVSFILIWLYNCWILFIRGKKNEDSMTSCIYNWSFTDNSCLWFFFLLRAIFKLEVMETFSAFFLQKQLLFYAHQSNSPVCFTWWGNFPYQNLIMCPSSSIEVLPISVVKICKGKLKYGRVVFFLKFYIYIYIYFDILLGRWILWKLIHWDQ